MTVELRACPAKAKSAPRGPEARAGGKPPLDRTKIVADLEAILPEARALGPITDLTVRQKLFELCAPLISCLSSQPEYQVEGGRWISAGTGSTNFTPEFAATALVAAARERGVQDAVDWLARLLAPKRSEIRSVTEVRGFQPPPGGISIGDVQFLRWDEQPVTAAAQFHSGSHFGKGLMSPLPAAVAIVRLPDIEVCGTSSMLQDTTRSEALLAAPAQVPSVAVALTAVLPNAWSLGRSWYDVVDPDIHKVEAGYTWSHQLQDAPDAFGSSELDPDQVAFAERYLCLTGKLRRKLDVASTRLNLARRRSRLGDKAIEGSISLEAMLGDDRFDLTYKLRLRASLITESGLRERREISETIKKFYAYRSKVVHGGEDSATPDMQVVIESGLKVCAAVIKRIAEHGKEPDWPAAEFGVGPLVTAVAPV